MRSSINPTSKCTVGCSSSPSGIHRSWLKPESVLIGLSGLLLLVGLIYSYFFSPFLVTSFILYPVNSADLFYLLATLSGGYFVARRGLAAARSFSLDIGLLMTLAMFGAVTIGETMEAASLAFLYPLAEILEDWATQQARSSIKSLMKLSPEQATVKKERGEVSLPLEEIKPGDTILVRPGGKIGLDGLVKEGSSRVDQSSITGESVPVKKSLGDEVYGGTMNVDGFLKIRVTKEAGNSTISRIIQLIKEAEKEKAPIERFVDTFASYYTPTVVGVAFVVATTFPFVFTGGFETWVLRAITLLVIACPCALVISTPVTVVSAISAAASNGILIKGGRFLEEMGRVKAVAFDKTGTLTQGRLKLSDVLPGEDFDRREILAIAASLERASEHHLAEGVIQRATEEGVNIREVDKFISLPGRGIEGVLDGRKFRVGKEELFAKNGLEGTRKLEKEGKTVAFVGTPERTIGALGFEDRLKPGTGKIISRLKEKNVKVLMLTGDNQDTAASIANQAGIQHYHGELLPEDKVSFINELSRKYGSVAMVGDGVNDGPALAAADIGVAMGAVGTEVAIETADIALMSDDLSGLPYLFDISRGGKRTIKQNIFLSLFLKLGLGAAAFPGLITLAPAVLVGDMGATFLVTFNAIITSRLK